MNIISIEGVAVCVLTKVASQSIMGSMINKTAVSESEARKREVCIAFVRDPIERFDSFFSQLYWMAHNGHKIEYFMPDSLMLNKTPDEAYQNYVDHILAGAVDVHWMLQSEQLKGIPNRLYPFEDIQKVWDSYFDCPLPWMNRYKKIPHSQHREAEIREFYEQDFELRERVA